MAQFTKAEVGIILGRELSERRDVYKKAKEYFDRATTSRAGKPPGPDEALHVQNASMAHSLALQAFKTALREHSRFIADGSIPARFGV